MADTDNIFSLAGFNVTRDKKSDDAPQALPSAAVPVPSAAPGLFGSAGFRTTGTATPPATTDWRDAEALESLAPQDFSANKSPDATEKKPGRGLVRALIDYPGHVLKGMVDTVAYPGNVLASTKPIQPEEMIPGAVNIAGLTGGAEFPRATAAAVVDKVAPSPRAINALVDTIGPENVPGVVNRLQSNPRLSIADTNDVVRTSVQGLIDPAQPRVQNLVSQAVKDRAATLPAATNSAFTEAMGPAPNVVTMVEGLKNRARDAGRNAIQPAIANAKPVDVSPVIAAIDKEVQPGIAGLKSGLPLSPRQEELWRLRNQLVNPETGETMVDAGRLHDIQSRTGDLAYQLQKSPDGNTRNVGNGLRDVNETLVDAIDQASGGTYRPARAKFKDAKDVSEAFESGFDTLKNRSGVTGLQDRPESFAEWMKTATPEEIVARRIGTRSDIDQKIRGVKNQALAGQSITGIEYNQEKLRMLFGDNEANRLIGVMKDAQDEAKTNYKLLEGSKTAETIAARDALKPREINTGNPWQLMAPAAAELFASQYGIPGAGLAWGALKAGNIGLQKIGQLSDIARNYQFARNALATGAERDATINALLSHPKVVSEMNKRLYVGRSPSNALPPP